MKVLYAVLTAVEHVAGGLSDVGQNDIVLPEPLPARQEGKQRYITTGAVGYPWDWSGKPDWFEAPANTKILMIKKKREVLT